jgi:predicted S18 family serine protease
MADPTHIFTFGPPQSALPALPPVFEGDDLYDQIMSEIEPELVSTVYKTLDEKYKNETPEEKALRQARYDKAFTEYQRRFQLYTNEWSGKLRTFQTGVVQALEADDRAEDDGVMLQLESAFAAA